MEREEKEWEREVVSTLESLAAVGVAEGYVSCSSYCVPSELALRSPSASNPFHVSQLHIILNRTDKLVNEFAAGLQSGEFTPDEPSYVLIFVLL